MLRIRINRFRSDDELLAYAAAVSVVIRLSLDAACRTTIVVAKWMEARQLHVFQPKSRRRIVALSVFLDFVAAQIMHRFLDWLSL